MMKSPVHWLLLLLLALAPGLALAQPCTPDQATEIPYHFRAVIPGTNTELTSLCVGQPVELQLVPPVASATVFYAVNPGTGLAGLPSPCNGFTFTSPYTPTAALAGPIVITANINLGAGGTRLVYFRSYTVNTIPMPTFTLAPCSSGQALVTITGPSYPRYTVQVGSGPATAVSGTAPFQVAAPSGSTVTLHARYTLNDPCIGSSTQTVRALPPAVPSVITRLTLAGPLPGAALFDLGSLPADYRYTLLLNNRPLPGTTGTVPPGNSPFPLPGATAGNYRLARADLCGAIPDTSAAIHTLDLTGAANVGHNILRFNYGAVPPLSFRVVRNNVVVAAALPPTAIGFDDSVIVCGTTYNYKVTAVLSGGRESVNEVTLRATAGPVPKPRVTASFSLDNVVELTSFLPPPNAGLPTGSHPHYRRSQLLRPTIDVGTTRGTAIVRDAATLDSLLLAPPCYTAFLVDTCGTASLPGPPTCPALLRAALADANGYSVQIDWTAFLGPDSSQPRTDTLLSITADGNILSRFPVTGGITYLDSNTPADRQTLRYRLKSTGAGLPPGAVSYSNVAEVTRQSSLVIPTAFTPNGDNLNDVLELKGRFLSNFTFIVVDRNGREAFRSTNRTDSWDGRISGHPPVNGAYVWSFKQTDETGKTRNMTGTVTILQ